MAHTPNIRKGVAWPGYLLAGLLSLFFGYLMAKQYIVGFGLIGIFLTLFVFAICVIRPEAGLYITIIYAFVVPELTRLFLGGHFQAGIPLDILLGLSLLGVIILGMRREDNAFFFGSRPVIWLLIGFGWVFLEGFNPLGRVAAWHQSVRKILEELVMLFVTFHVLRSEAAIRRFIRALFVTAVMVGAFGCLEQWFGLPAYDKFWAQSDPTRFSLFFIGNQFRKFSLMSDPTDFGMVMAACSTFFLILAIYLRGWRRIMVFAAVIPMLLGMSYSGTRTSNIMVIAGLALYVLLTLNRRITRIFAFSAAFVLLVLIRLPIYTNSTLNRFRSSFSGTEDASFNLRVLERKATQPYILPHPIGGGVGTTNNFGLMMAPGHELAGIQTDDGYLRIALEQGWIGLIMVCIMVYFILQAGVRGYFRSKSEWRQGIYGAALAGLFGFILAQLAQEVVGQVAVDVVFFPFIGIILRLNQLDRHELEAQQAS
jgi:putative inorganic carbon (HCO3(-)) transporter